MEYKHFGFSDPGKIRNNNEDSYLCNEKEGLFLVADGMGGHASGETASQLAISGVEEFVILSRSEDTDWPLEYYEDLTLEQNRLLSAASTANNHIIDVAYQNHEMRGMGTTLVGAIIEEDHLAVINVGDSRLYLVREGEIRQITQDHSLVAEQVRAGILTREEASKHPQRHVLTSALGIEENPEMEVSLTGIMPEDMYLICSDGLHDMLNENEILKTLCSMEDKNLYKIGLSLVLNANLAGGLDNITVVLLYFNNT